MLDSSTLVQNYGVLGHSITSLIEMSLCSLTVALTMTGAARGPPK